MPPSAGLSGMFKQRFVVGVAVEAMNNYGRLILRGIHRYANARREWLLHEELRPGMADFSRWPRCDGLIFAGVGAATVRTLRRKARHLVSCSSTTDSADMPVVTADNAAIGRLAGEHLMDRQLRHFAFYGSRDVGGRSRLVGFRNALTVRGFSCQTYERGDAADGETSSHRHWPALTAWLQSLPKPVGIMARDDNDGSDLAAACLSCGIAVPDQVAIVAVNNDDIICEAAWPPLSSVEVDFSHVGYLAARQLDTLLSGGVVQADDRHLQVPPVGVFARLSTELQAADGSALSAAVAFIREHARSGCTVGDLLKAVPVSRSWLERQFHDKLGRTPHDEIVRVRMDHARRLLVDTGEPVRRIAERCGFSALQNFNRAFAQHQGVTPAAYRRTHRPH